MSIPEVASFGDKQFLWFLVRSEYASYFWTLGQIRVNDRGICEDGELRSGCLRLLNGNSSAWDTMETVLLVEYRPVAEQWTESLELVIYRVVSHEAA